MPMRMVSSALASCRVTNCAIKTKRNMLIALVIMAFLQGGSLYYSRTQRKPWGVGSSSKCRRRARDCLFFVTLPQLCQNYMTLCVRIGKIDRLIAFFPFQLAPDGGWCFSKSVGRGIRFWCDLVQGVSAILCNSRC